jgi:hypothetical protein
LLLQGLCSCELLRESCPGGIRHHSGSISSSRP